MPRCQQGLLVSCEVPWDDKERVLEEVFRQQVRHLRRYYNYLYIFGTAGEGYAVDTERYRQIVQLFYGECSLLSSFGPMSPHKITEYFEAGRTRQVEKVFAMQKQFEELMTDVLGCLLTDGRVDGTYDKILVRPGGLEEMPLRMLSPYQGNDDTTYHECKRILHTKYPEFVAPELAPARP